MSNGPYLEVTVSEVGGKSSATAAAMIVTPVSAC